jgi:hypothetical protein
MVGVRVPVGARSFSSARRPDRSRPPIQCLQEALSPGVKWLGREAEPHL